MWLWLSVVPGLAEGIRRYSGRVERVDLGEGLVIVDELARGGRRVRHEVHVSPETPIVSAARLRPWQMRDARAYGEVPVTLLDVVAGDFVIVESVEEGGRAMARTITIVETPVRPPANR